MKKIFALLLLAASAHGGVMTQSGSIGGDVWQHLGTATTLVNTGDSVGIGTAAPGAALTVLGTGNSPAATFSPNLSSATASGALSGTFANTALGPCVAGSTQTLNLPVNVGSIEFIFHGTVSVNSLAAVIAVGVLVDGAFVDGETATKGLTGPLEPVSTDGTNMGFTTIVSGLSAASHTYCLTAFVSAGTGTVDSTNSVAHLHAHMLP